MYFYSILFLSIFFVTSCSDPIVFPCNTKDQNRSCKIEPPQLIDISSFDVDTIRIVAMQNNEADSVKIYRVGKNIFNEEESKEEIGVKNPLTALKIMLGTISIGILFSFVYGLCKRKLQLSQ